MDICLENNSTARIGDDLVGWMRTQPHLVDCCLVVVTAFPEPESAVKAFKYGAFHYLMKFDAMADRAGMLKGVLRAGIVWHRAHKMRRELLKTLDSTRLVSGVSDLLREALDTEQVHIIIFPSDGTPVAEGPRRFIDKIVSGAMSVIEQKMEAVAALDPILGGAGSLIAVPILAARSQVRGVLEVESQHEGAFSEWLGDVLRYLADLIGIALEIGNEVELIVGVYRELRHSIATNVQIVAMQARRLQKLTLYAPPESGESAESIRDRVRFIAENAAIIEKSLQDIKAIALQPPKPESVSVDVTELASACLEEQAPKLLEWRIRGGFSPEGTSIFLSTSPDMLAYCFRCILNNATEAIQDDRRQRLSAPGDWEDRIDITVQDTGTAVRIEIHDSGAGFDEEVARRLFLPMFSTKTKRLSSGEMAESMGVDRVERLLDLMSRWSRWDPRTQQLPAGLGQGMELFIRDGDTVEMHVGHRQHGGLNLARLEASALCRVGTDSPLAGEWLGRGEGLFSVQKYIARLGGTITAWSGTPKEGSETPQPNATAPMRRAGKGATLVMTLPKLS
jgi:signal transduction histidine kinase